LGTIILDTISPAQAKNYSVSSQIAIACGIDFLESTSSEDIADDQGKRGKGMNPDFMLNNLVAWSLQIALMVVAATVHHTIEDTAARILQSRKTTLK
jgi:hypothetical protein